MDFSTIIYESLNSIQYSTGTDVHRFLAAVQDLATDFPQEKKFLYRNMDAKLLRICEEALSCNEHLIEAVRKKATRYILDEAKTSQEWADEISKALIYGFYAYGQGKGMPTPEAEDDTPDRDKASGPNTGFIAIKETEQEPKPTSRVTKKKLIICAAAVLFAVGAAIGLYSYFFSTVPDVVGLDETEAEYLINDAGLIYVEDGREFSNSVEQGCVIEQSVTSKKARRGTEIGVIISKGEAITVPDLKKKSIENASEKAKKLGLTVEVKAEEYSDSIKKGRIIKQNPKAGELCEKGSVIEVVKSKGIEQITVPDVIGETAENAESILKGSGFQVKTQSEYSSSYSSGLVIRQSEKAGEKTDKGSTVTITVSLGKAPVVTKATQPKTESPDRGEQEPATPTTTPMPTTPAPTTVPSEVWDFGDD